MYATPSPLPEPDRARIAGAPRDVLGGVADERARHDRSLRASPG